MDENAYYLLLLISFTVGAWIWARPQNLSSPSTLQVWIAPALSVITMLGITLTAQNLFKNASVHLDPNNKLEVIALEIRDLLKRLPDPSVAEKYHKEIIDAIGRGTSTPTATSGDLTVLGAIMLSLAVVPFAIALLITLFGPSRQTNFRNKLVSFAMVPTAALSLMVVLEKFSVDKFLGIDLRDMHLVTFESGKSVGAPPQDLDLRIHVTADETELDCGDGDNYKIGPFADGTAGDTSMKPDVKNLSELKAKIADLTGTLEEHRLKQRLLGLILVGSADIRELKPPLTHSFGSNAGLAQARAEWVRIAIGNSMSPKPKTILTLSSGPAHVGLDPLPENLAKDRSVRVCAIWGSK